MKREFAARIDFFVDFQSTLICGGLLFAGALLQSVIGFGMGVATIPIIVWMGISVENAVTVLIPCVFCQTLFNCFQNRHELPWSEIKSVFILRLIGLPIGILTLHWSVTQSQDVARTILGMSIFVIIGLQILTSKTTGSLAAGWIVPTGLTSGFFAGLIGMGGPSLVLWVVRQDWTTQRQRVFLWLSFLLIIPFQAVLMVWSFGNEMLTTIAFGTAIVPFSIAGAWLGNHYGKGISPVNLRTLMYCFLIVIAIHLLFF